MLFLTNDDVAKVFDLPTCLGAMEAGARDLTEGEVAYGRSELTAPSGREDGYFNLSTMLGAVRRLNMVAFRLKLDIIYWPDGQLTEEKFCIEPGTYSGLILLVSALNAEPLALMHDGYIQHMRMAASASLGVRHLARAGASSVGVLGSGGMARFFLPAICAVRDIRRARVYSPTPEHRAAYAQELSRTLSIPVEAQESPREAVRGADIVCLCADSTRPVLDAAWVQPGTHVIATRVEASPELMERADVSMRLAWGLPPPAGAQSEASGRFSIYLGDREGFERFPREGSGMKSPQLVQMEDLVSGRAPGRTNDQQITYFITEGTHGVHIAAAAAAVYQRAREQGVGRTVPSEWFTQTIRD